MQDLNTSTTRASVDASGLSPVDRAFSVLAHMSSLLGYAIPFGQFLGPYTIQLVWGSESEFVSVHTREVLNFHLTVLAELLLGFLLSPLGVGWTVIVAALSHSMIQTVRGARAASRSEPFRYPFALPLLTRTRTA